jgi:hypothetical protein
MGSVHRCGGDGVVTVVAHHAILNRPPPGAAIISSLTSPPSRNPYRADAAHSFIVTVMKPVVHVPRYQVLPWILSGGAVPDITDNSAAPDARPIFSAASGGSQDGAPGR